MDKPIGKTSYLYWALPKYGMIPQNALALSVRPRLWKASFRSTQDRTSHLDLPSILKISLGRGVVVFHLIILVFNSLQSTTGLLFLVPFLATNSTGQV